ncbi:MAG TPA: hypothetical protein VK095_15160 [Beutenbergiaceae bacterium]|nr:hypothetical protein [Beutenbergiaceae bacterium]
MKSRAPLKSHAPLTAAMAAALVLAGCSAPNSESEPAETSAAVEEDRSQDEAGSNSQGSGEHEADSDDTTAAQQYEDLLRTPDPDQDPLPVVSAEGARLPYHLEGRVLVEGPWDVLPQERNGTFLAPRERDGALDFTAVDAEGAVLWTAQRPASCAGFAVTGSEDGQDLAVLTDLTSSEESLSETTATAYDLHSGAQAWGPVPVDGPHVGPGLVFSAPGDAPMGAMGARLVLDGGSGEVVAQEVDDGVHVLGVGGSGEVVAQYDDAHILGEYEGIVLLVEGDDLVALDADEAREEWRLTEQGWKGADLAPAAGARPGGSLALLQTASGSQVAIDLSAGSVLAEGVTDMGTDPATGTHVLVEDDHARAYDPEGEELWAYLLTGPTTITSTGGVMVFLRSGETVRVHNVLTGEVAEAYDPDGEGEILVPAQISAAGATVVVAEDGYRLVTVTPDGTGQEDGDGSTGQDE